MDDKQKIFTHLMKEFNNALGVCALMGNLYAESGLKANNLQNSGNRKLLLTDEAYTSAVDKGNYGNFVYDAQGYGLAQWTYWSRKQNLLNYATAKGKSIGDLEMQLDFLISELKGYTSVYKAIKEAESIRACSDIIVTQYERPANQTVANLQKRASYGDIFYKELVNSNEDSNYFIHTVVKGDTLWALAKRYYGAGIKYFKIIKDNDLKTTTIEIGQKLKIERS